MADSRSFHVAVFRIDGELTVEGIWQLTQLSPHWLEFSRGVLQTNGDGFRKFLAVPQLEHIEFEFTWACGCGLGSFYSRGELVTSTAYFTGEHVRDEQHLQRMFIASLRRIELVRQAASSSAPFAGIASLASRPLHVVVPWGPVSISDQDHRVVSELSNHIAGAVFYPEQYVAV